MSQSGEYELKLETDPENALRISEHPPLAPSGSKTSHVTPPEDERRKHSLSIVVRRRDRLLGHCDQPRIQQDVVLLSFVPIWKALGLAPASSMEQVNIYTKEEAWTGFRWGPTSGTFYANTQFPKAYVDDYIRQIQPAYRNLPPPAEQVQNNLMRSAYSALQWAN